VLQNEGQKQAAILRSEGEARALVTVQTAQAFLFYAPQLPFAALDQLFIVAFYARQDTRTPVLVGVGTVLLDHEGFETGSERRDPARYVGVRPSNPA